MFRDVFKSDTGKFRTLTYISVRVASVLLAVVCAASCNSSAVSTRQFSKSDLLSAVEMIALLPGEPASVSAGGLTRDETALVTIENGSAYESAVPNSRRLVIVGGLDGHLDSARLALDAVRWFKSSASDQEHARWVVSVLPFANPTNAEGMEEGVFPPVDGYFDDDDHPELRYLWRWVSYQVPDLVVELRVGDEIQFVNSVSLGSSAEMLPDGSLAGAMSLSANGSEIGPVNTMLVTAPPSEGARVMQEILTHARDQGSSLRAIVNKRLARKPLDIAHLLAKRYPGTPGMSYIPAVAWTHTLRLAELVGDESLRDKVLREVQPWLTGNEPLVGERPNLAGLAGTMVFGELSKSPSEYRESAAALASEGVSMAAREASPGVPEYGFGWSDDIFLGSIAAATAEDADGLASAVRMITLYAERLQQPDGIFHHSPEAPTAWGRGNGFAARGLAETLTALGPSHTDREAVLEVYLRQMRGLKAYQAPDGMWRQVVDVPGSYRETSVTALTLTAMARGIRLGWLDDSYQPIVDRAWNALLAHVNEDGTLVDVCISTGAGDTLRHYLDRTAVNGADDRGGALVLGAALEMHALLESAL